MNSRTRRILIVVGAVAVIAVLAIGLLFSTRDGDDDATADSTASQGSQARADEEELGLARRDPDDVLAVGDVDAPVVLIEYSDYRCPFCGVFSRETMPKLQEKYIDTGKVRFEWRDFPVFGPESVEGAVAARAAGEQGLYWEYHDALYRDAPTNGHLDIDRQKILAWAEDVGVPDMEKFEADLDDPELQSLVDQDAEEASRLGTTGTPTFFIGKTPMVGAQPADVFDQYIDAELEKAGVN
ncbi:MAG: DsbA family protein [Corynebacterium sp.]|uniref:DsbA family protein n=1 Tax=unclassified Corynebacterium TaxID=2624378 RepID=UPI00095E22DB|nr:DsbA family protein [Corynebacterium sp. CNJ-954]OLT53695.1 disulfide bond formation protein [Corynebacterium sp. CNJ-954]